MGLCAVYVTALWVILPIYGDVYQAGNAGLTTVPLDIPENSLLVNLSFNHITQVLDGAFGGLSQLAKLYISDSALQELGDQALTGTALHHLDLSNNQLTHVPDFQAVQSTLVTLQLTNNFIFEIQQQLHGMAALETAELNSNNIHNISDTAFCGTKLYVLKLGNNKLTRFPQLGVCIGNTLKEVRLNGNEINELQADDFYGLSNLHKLYLSGNSISRLEEYTFRWLSSLTYLHIGGISVEYVDDLAFFNTSIEIIHLENNPLSIYPNLSHVAHSLNIVLLPPIIDYSHLVPLPNVYQFSMSFPTVLNTSIPPLAPYFPGVTILQLWGVDHNPLNANLTAGLTLLQSVLIKRTSLTEIPHLSQSANHIHTLNLESNLIHTVRDSDFQGFSKLRILKLSSNQLKSVESLNDVADTLKELYLDENPDLGDLHDSLYQPLSALRVLCLSGTSLTLLPDLSSASATLEDLDVSDNNISVVHSDRVTVLQSLTAFKLHSSLNQLTGNLVDLSPWVHSQSQLSSLDMRGNAFPCDCGTVWIKDLLSSSRGSSVLKLDDSPCSEPVELTATELKSIPRKDICAYSSLTVQTHWRTQCVLHCSRLASPYSLCVGVSYDVTTSLCSLNVTDGAAVDSHRLSSVSCSGDAHYMTCG